MLLYFLTYEFLDKHNRKRESERSHIVFYLIYVCAAIWHWHWLGLGVRFVFCLLMIRSLFILFFFMQCSCFAVWLYLLLLLVWFGFIGAAILSLTSRLSQMKKMRVTSSRSRSLMGKKYWPPLALHHHFTNQQNHHHTTVECMHLALASVVCDCFASAQMSSEKSDFLCIYTIFSTKTEQIHVQKACPIIAKNNFTAEC